MLNMDITFEGFSKPPNNDQIMKQIRADLENFFKQAYSEFVRGLIDAMGNNWVPKDGRTGVETGMTLGSVQPLASAVGAGSHINRRKAEIRKSKIATPTLVKSFTEGVRLGAGAYKLYLGTLDKDQFYLEFNISTFQHELWEDRWQTLVEGVRAFDQYVSSNIDNILNIDTILNKLI